MLVQALGHGMHRPSVLRQRGRHGQGSACCVTCPACQRAARVGDLGLGLGERLRQPGHGFPCCKYVGRGGPGAAQGGLSRVHPPSGFVAHGHQHGLALLGGTALEPGERRLALDRRRS